MVFQTRLKKSWRGRLFLLFTAVALGLAIVAVSVPNLLRSRIASNEASAVGSLRTLNTALVSYNSDHPSEGYPQKLSDLSPYVDRILASGQKSGYHFRYTPDTPDIDGTVKQFRVEAVPVAEQTGQRRFSSNQSGTILYQASLAQPEAPLDGNAPQQPQTQPATIARRMVREGSLSLIVSQPEATAGQIRKLLQQLDGYVESERSDLGMGTKETTITIRVPAGRFEEARLAIRALGERVYNEQDNAKDVTGQHVDLESHLRNYRAEEAQYREIMRHAGSIKDTLAVSEHLADVRGRIERTQGQFDLLTHQTEMASLEVNLRTEAVERSAEVHWRPVAEITSAFWSAADDLSTYANFMIAVFFRLPVYALWTFTGFATFFSGWRFVRWMWRKWAPSPIASA